MNNVEKFLFVYSLLITTIILFAAILFSPKPSNFLIILFLAPVVYYLWLKMVAETDKKTNKAFGKKTVATIALILITSVILSSAGIYLYSKKATPELVNEKGVTESIITSDLLRSQKNTQVQELPKDIGTELASIKEELVKLRAEQRGISAILGISTSPEEIQEILSDLDSVEGLDVSTDNKIALGSISIKQNYTRIDAHEEPAASSRIVGSIQKENTYPYSDKQGNWYLIKTDQGTTGWVFSSFVEEVIP